jgi:hypothetical protein
MSASETPTPKPKSKPAVYFMTGRFQPFTLGHLKLFNEMLTRASTSSPDAPAYLFVSYKNPKFSVKNVKDMYEEVGKASPDHKVIRDYAKTKGGILDNPLTTDTRLDFVKLLLKKIYGESESVNGKETKPGSGIFEYTFSLILDIDSMFASDDHLTGDTTSAMTDLSRPVTLFLVNSRITETGGYKPYHYLKRMYGRNFAVKMVAGAGEDWEGYPNFFSNQNNPITRVEKNSHANNVSPSKLSGSKIRMLCMLYDQPQHRIMAMKYLMEMYYNLLTEAEIKSILITPINESIKKLYLEKNKKTKLSKSTAKSSTATAKSSTAKSTLTIKNASTASQAPNSRRVESVTNKSTALRRSGRTTKVTYNGSNSEHASYGKGKTRKKQSK